VPRLRWGFNCSHKIPWFTWHEVKKYNFLHTNRVFSKDETLFVWEVSKAVRGLGGREEVWGGRGAITSEYGRRMGGAKARVRVGGSTVRMGKRCGG
jgi:hypothetical protein